ncbi:NfeD family protein [Aphanothece sacrum]|uniref:NfeD-like C-terminal domain-containing protein n=1 Tax=Aphanothece sacrum FPU1 TaxID=1920663 RepID=A0A401IIK9_APHSA|nr:NfeD family protein [Aphanothece sacrum]GBF81127.1 hypothetical protein AsFPU1_2539 [Aphanothece sacrum FPU1]GBF86217.1 hypothetical protein AsFPU3_3288 [Aphanothece sacrum FPU3]
MLSQPLLWLIAGAILCFMEAVFPVAFVAFIMGISAIGVAAIALVVPYFSVQVILWLSFSTLLVVGSRQFLPNKKALQSQLGDSQEGETLTEIIPGQPGRVLYEGNSWRAICADENLAIAPQKKVYIVSREGNTLIILPDFLTKSDN